MTSTAIASTSNTSPVSCRVVLVSAKVVRAACFVAFLLLATLSFVLAAASATSPRSQLSIMGRDVLIVKSGSMSPAFDTGDAVLLRRVDSTSRSRLHAGDVVTFRTAANPDLVVTHRIAEVITATDGSVTYITKGDANQSRDDTVLTPDRIIGVVNAHVPRGGYVLFALQQPRISGLFLIALMLAHAGVLASRAAVPQREKRENNET